MLLTTYTYKEGNGRLKELTYANGHTMKATYNRIGQLVAEKWYDAAQNGTQIAYYKYVYDGNGNIVRSIDFGAEKEYTYTYENGVLVRAAEYDITFNDSEIVTGKVLADSVHYVYDQNGKLAKKRIFTGGEEVRTLYYETSEENETILRMKTGERTVLFHGKTDSFGRREFDELQLNGTGTISRSFVYHEGEVTEEHKENRKKKSSPTTSLVSRITFADGRTLSYEYDKEERITKVVDSLGETTEYTYDALGQLKTETVTDAEGTATVVNTMAYDNYGNITGKNGIAYTYGNDQWKDLLTGYGGQTIACDAQGNPTSYLGHTLTWEKGRQLKFFDNCTYTYNANGIRTGKTVNGVEHIYMLDGSRILRELWGSNELMPIYDNADSVSGIIYNGVSYYFQKNLQGDVIELVDEEAEVVARYTYDAWGKVTGVRDKNGNAITDTAHIAHVNPFRYRGYYFDAEIGLYYLQSRYYDPVVGRFVNADDAICLKVSEGILGYNLLEYCKNNPANNYDPTGYWVVSFGVEFGAAFVLGLYLAVGVNCDGENISVTFSTGFLIITNVAASVSGYFAYYPNKKSVNDLNGCGVSVGAAISLGVHIGGSGGFEMMTGGNGVSLSVGAGISIVDIPYFQVKGGYTWTIVNWKLDDIRNGITVVKRYLATKIIEVTKKANHTNVYIYLLKKTIRIYTNKKVEVY